MRSVIACFSPDDTLLVERAAMLRVVDYCDGSVTIEVRRVDSRDPATLFVGSEWCDVYRGLHIRFHGLFINEKCQPARRVAIEFQDDGRFDVRRDTLGGMRIRGGSPFLNKRAPDDED